MERPGDWTFYRIHALDCMGMNFISVHRFVRRVKLTRFGVTTRSTPSDGRLILSRDRRPKYINETT
jgi:hypothetical protein